MAGVEERDFAIAFYRAFYPAELFQRVLFCVFRQSFDKCSTMYKKGQGTCILNIENCIIGTKKVVGLGTTTQNKII